MKTLFNAKTLRARRRATLCVLIIMINVSSVVWGQSIITTVAGAQAPFNGAQAIEVAFTQTQFVVPDGSGGFYFSVADPLATIYRVTASGTVTAIAGSGAVGYSGDGGPATSAKLSNPSGVVLDSAGNLLIADTGNHRIRKVTTAGTISTIAGNGTLGFGGDGGPATSAQLNFPNGVALDRGGNLFIADLSNHRVRKVTPSGIISTVAGTGVGGFGGDGGPATSARFSQPASIIVDNADNLFIADSSNSRVRKITADGVVSTVAGNGTFGFTGDNGPATSAQLTYPRGLALNATGDLLIADFYSQRIRKVTTAGIITTIAGTGSFAFGGDGLAATSAQLAAPLGVAVDGSGNIFIADSENRRIRKVNPTGIITTVAGNGTYGFSGDSGPAVSALLNHPQGLAFDPAGNLLIADTRNSRIRKLTPSGVISTFAGNGNIGSSGDGGPPTAAELNNPSSIAVRSNGVVFMAQCPNRIRVVDLTGNIITFAASILWAFCGIDYYSYDLVSAGGVAIDAAANVFIADTFHYRVEKIPPGGLSRVVAGTGTFGFSGDGGPASSARISEPRGIAVDATGNLYIADSYNNRIRKVTPAGIISTIAGTGDNAGYGGDGGLAVSALLNFPSGLAVDAAGNIFIADTNNHRIRKVDQAGIITTVAGNGEAGVGGDGGAPTSAQLNSPRGVAVDAAGNLYIADTDNHRIRKVTFGLTIPTFSEISSTLAAQGSATTVSLQGTSFVAPLVIDAGTGITVSNVLVLSDTRAAATFTIAANAPPGTRNINVTTALGTSGNVSFDVVPPFPDLSIAIAQGGNWEVGFNGAYTMTIVNAGLAATTGPITVTDILPAGLTFVSGTGSGWSCSIVGQSMSCTHSEPVAPGATPPLLTITVAVGAGVGSQVSHSATATASGDLAPNNNTTSDTRNVVAPFLNYSFTPVTLLPAGQASVALNIPGAFAHDITGTLTLTFSSNAVSPADDPAIQFSGGGRTVNFAIAANTTQARFDSNNQAGPVAFQTGTVAGTLSFSAMLQTGTVQTTFPNGRTIPLRAPTVHSARSEPATGGAFNVVVNSSSTPREVTHLVLTFSTNPVANLSCGALSGCTASGSTLSLDVKSLFAVWFAGNAQFGSLSTLRVPLTITGAVRGSVQISLRNGMGVSNAISVPLP